MSNVWIDRLWMTVGITLLVAACARLAWAIVGDWVRGLRAKRAGKAARRRCRKCWYDMTGVAGLRCPECGREAKNERGLRRSKRRWGRATLALMLLLPAHVAWRMPAVREHGWARLVPMVVLVSWPMDVEEWADGSPTDWVGKEIQSRRDKELIDWVSQRILAGRLRAKWASKASDGLEVAVIDVGQVGHNVLIPAYRDPHPRAPIQTRMDEHVEDWNWSFNRFITNHIDVHVWLENGGDGGRIRSVGTQTAIVAPAATLRRIRSLVKALGTSSSRGSISESEDCTIVGLDAWEDGPAWWVSLGPELRPSVLLGVVQRTTCPHAWNDSNSGVLVADFEGRMIILGPSDIRERSRTVLEAIQAGKPVRLGPFTASNASGTSTTEYVAMWPLGDVLQAIGALTIDEIARRNVKAGKFNALTSIPGHYGESVGNAIFSAQEAHQSLNRWLENTQTTAWPGDAMFVMAKDLAVLWTTRPEIIDHVNAALRETAGPRPGN